jgi:hypothetical protein
MKSPIAKSPFEQKQRHLEPFIESRTSTGEIRSSAKMALPPVVDRLVRLRVHCGQEADERANHTSSQLMTQRKKPWQKTVPDRLRGLTQNHRKCWQPKPTSSDQNPSFAQPAANNRDGRYRFRVSRRCATSK